MATEVTFPCEEEFEFSAAGGAAEETRGEDDQQQRHNVQGLFDALLPVLFPGDVGPVLEYRELLTRLHPDFGGQTISELAELAVVVLVIEAGVAHKGRRLIGSGHNPSFLAYRTCRAQARPAVDLARRRP